MDVNVVLSPDVSEARSYRDYTSYYGDRRMDSMNRDYRQTGAVADMVGAFSDWERSGGGYGGGCCGGCGYSGGGSSASFFSDGTLFALLAGAALAFYILYSTITMNAAAAGTGTRFKRGLRKKKHEEDDDNTPVGFEDILWMGRLFNASVVSFKHQVSYM